MPTIVWWRYPLKSAQYYGYSKKPLFWGLYFGVFELRFFPKSPVTKEDSETLTDKQSISKTG